MRRSGAALAAAWYVYPHFKYLRFVNIFGSNDVVNDVSKRSEMKLVEFFTEELPYGLPTVIGGFGLKTFAK